MLGIANEFALAAKLFEVMGPLDQIQLNKCMYLTQEVSISLYNKPILDIEFETWKYGAVPRKLRYPSEYSSTGTRVFGRNAMKQFPFVEGIDVEQLKIPSQIM